ncbi:replication protein P [Aeromonas hydrophila]|uniref:replication protein P n=1 Tax=Aeromonas hydrophila TaxID=644 RepID=UPI002B481A80|nr:replication protein P [Aeromonas hydrophila]
MSMKPLSTVLNDIACDVVGEVPVHQQMQPLTEHDTKTVSRLLEQLKAVFPAWQRAYPTEELQRSALAEWTRALVDAGCTSREQLQRGMRVARSKPHPWIPSTGEFIQWCQITPESLGLPTLDTALVEVRTRRFTHPAVELAAKATSWERQTLSLDAYRPVFEQAYAQLLRRVVAGENLGAEVLKGLPTRVHIQHSPEYYQKTGLRGVESLKALFKRRKGGSVQS